MQSVTKTWPEIGRGSITSFTAGLAAVEHKWRVENEDENSMPKKDAGPNKEGAMEQSLM